ncbi:hypothetical protein [Nisaea sp.]|uniref:hypothetical protein n=1 Tax=Nisaea sp. TaxID=2024842 RepID=UPI0032EDCA5C
MPLVIEHDGVQIEFPDDSLLICVDETGHEDFVEPNAPFFGLAGCVCGAGDYSCVVDTPWQVVEQSFPTEMLPLHASDLQPSKVGPDQFAAIDHIFINGVFGRFATVAKAGIENESTVPMPQLLEQQTFQPMLNTTPRRTGSAKSSCLSRSGLASRSRKAAAASVCRAGRGSASSRTRISSGISR